MKARTFFAALILAGCATTPTPMQEARTAYEKGRFEQALQILERAHKENPADHALRAEYLRVRDLVAARVMAQAETLRMTGQLEAAEVLYQRVQQHEPNNARAVAGLEQLAADKRHREVVAQAEKLVRDERYRDAGDLLRPVLTENPQQRDARRLQRAIDERLAKPASAGIRLRTPPKPITLELRDVPLRGVFDLLGNATGVTFVLDRDVRADQRTSISVRNAGVEEVIQLVSLANQLEHKVLNERTVFVYPSTPQKLREHQELVVKAFYLVNADVKQTANMIRTLVKTRDIFFDEKINLLVLKDTPHAIQLAERLVAAQDLAEPEVMLEVEVLEVGRNRILELGIRFPDSVAYSLVGAAGTPGTVTLPEWLNRGSELVQLTFTNPLFLFSLKQQDDSTSVLASPRIRVKNKEKARIHIGDRVPVITTTAAATGGFVSESVTYLDVGLRLEVEPLIHLEDEVAIKVALEVSNIAREIRTVGSNTLTYQIGTRNANTALRLRDGETQILAGLISDEDRRTANRVPGLGELPVMGRLFSHTRDTIGRTEVVLLITPRLVRTLVRPDARTVEFAAGTEASTGARPGPITPLVLPVAPTQSVPGTPTPSIPGTPGQPAPEDAKPAAPAPGAAPSAPVPQPMVPFGGVRPPGQ
jgi:general secretion pathway protein D